MLKLERFFPLVISSIFIVCAHLLGLETFELARFDLIIGSLITVAITIIGFALTIVTILIAIIDTDAMKLIKDNDTTKQLTKYLFSPIIYGTALIIDCFYLFLVIDEPSILSKIHLYPLIFLTVYETISIIRISMIMSRVIKLVAGEKSNQVSTKVAKGEDAFN